MAIAEAYDYQEWLAVHAGYCRRLAANITHAACQSNQCISSGMNGDLRCSGCGGLDDQPAPEARRTTLTVIEGCHHSPVPPMEELDPLSRAFTAALQEILDEDREQWLDDELVDGLRDDDLDGSEPQNTLENAGAAGLDPLTQLLLSELQRDDKENNQEMETIWLEIVEQPQRKQRVQVYVGRCMRCEGYMVHAAKECHDGIVDDEIYRCFCCGWRVSPAYDYNRKHPGVGWR